MTIDNEPVWKRQEGKEETQAFDLDDYDTSWDELERWLEQVKQGDNAETSGSLVSDIEHIYSTAIDKLDSLFTQLDNLSSNIHSTSDPAAVNPNDVVSEVQQYAAVACTMQRRTEHLDSLLDQLRSQPPYVAGSADARRLCQAIEMELAGVSIEKIRLEQMRQWISAESATLQGLKATVNDLSTVCINRIGEHEQVIQRLAERLACTISSDADEDRRQAESTMGTY